MIETQESRAEFEKRRERAKAAMKSAIRGELPFSSDTKQPEITKPLESVITDGATAYVITAESDLCPRCKEILRLRTKRSREKK